MNWFETLWCMAFHRRHWTSKTASLADHGDITEHECPRCGREWWTEN